MRPVLSPLRLVSDEAELIDAGNDSTATENVAGLSVKAVVEYALAKIGATLQPCAADAELANTDPIEVSRNLFLNPGGEINTTNWLTGAAATTLGRSTAIFRSGASSISGTINTGTVATLFMNASGGIPCAPGDAFNASVWVRLSTGTGSAIVTLRSTTSAGATITNYPGTAVAVNATGWTRVSAAATLVGATVANVNAYVNVTGMAVSRVLYADDTTLTRGLTLLADFSGATAPSGLNYYEWTGDAHASEFVHLQKANKATTWEPGTVAWDYVAPLVQTGGLRLFCDEQRRWWLIDPLSYSVPGQVNVAAGVNATRGSDTISRQQESWYDAVVVEYRWKDEAGIQQVVYDAASDGGTKLYIKTVERPYPGPGAAATLLAWFIGRGRTLDLRSLTDLAATPGMGLIATLPGTPTQVGIISSVTWEWSAEGDSSDEMQLGSRGLIDTSDTAWIFQPGGYRWQDVPSGQSWPEYETP